MQETFVSRPVLRYLGSKFRLANWIISHFPAHRAYAEPFAGGAAVLMRKPRAHIEALNDLNGEVVNIFQVLRDHGEELRRLCELTPFARAEFDLAYEPTDDRIERARRALVRSWMGQGGDAVSRGYRTGFRCYAHSPNRGASTAQDWTSWPAEVPAFVQRLQGVIIECVDALALIQRYDAADTLIYCDPPYPHSTRAAAVHGKMGYSHEMTDQQHRELAEVLRSCRSMVVLSGYPCDLYDTQLYPDWERRSIEARADRGGSRTECVWLNAAAARLHPQQRLAI